MRDRVRFLLDGTLILRQPTNGNLERPWLLKLEQDLAATIRSQRLPECFFELVERVHMLHRGGGSRRGAVSMISSRVITMLFSPRVPRLSVSRTVPAGEPLTPRHRFQRARGF
jgi:hypothetical protein